MKRKEFEKLFATFNENGKQIWVIGRVKDLPKPIVNMALNLAALDFIKYIRICDETLAASSENYPNRQKMPITNMNHETAIGVQVLYSLSHKYINFFDINSPIKGNGSKMVDAILRDFPKDWNPSVVMDWSNGFWDKMKEKYKDVEWIM
ncbi:hypothetical protein [Williamwhitmania taraxaci]|uniref:Uncharacterized protein n=1 Tax=Williamwhitmania taraxaci TaxID=1640674 RepID=A0A1G6T5W8_9BACT|nr:hypothetical protein [Williamwhitmania taraxaci]SDD24343.1 hypothetical protein SAMN05216323_11131 [Williamwhitmania taraxaci]